MFFWKKNFSDFQVFRPFWDTEPNVFLNVGQTPPKKRPFFGGVNFFENRTFKFNNNLQFFLVKHMEVSDSGTTGSLMISICTHSRHISKFDGAHFDDFSAFFFKNYIWKTVLWDFHRSRTMHKYHTNLLRKSPHV